MDYFKFLPVEIALDILSRLPTQSVVTGCKLVSKSWNKLVHHPSFSRMHLRRLNHSSSDSDADSCKSGFLAFTDLENFYYFEYTDYENHDESKPIQRFRNVKITFPLVCGSIRIVGSCNGLICLVRRQYVWICNPITREEVLLTEMKEGFDISQYRYCSFGFGYVSSTDEYKIVGIYVMSSNVDVHIYTLGSGRGWRNVGKFNFGSKLDLDQVGFFVNGALYWMAKESETILTFDLTEEIFCQHLSTPPLPPEGKWLRKRLGVLDGFLCFASGRDGEADGFDDLWLLKGKNDNHDMKERNERQTLGWSKEFMVDKNNLLAVTKSDDTLTYGTYYLNIYDTKTSTSNTVLEYDEQFTQIYPHKNTLVSLRELGEEDTETMKSHQFYFGKTESCD